MEEITINLDPGPFLEDLALLETAPELVERFVSAIDAGDVLGAVDPDPVSTDAGHYLYRLEPVGLMRELTLALRACEGKVLIPK